MSGTTPLPGRRRVLVEDEHPVIRLRGARRRSRRHAGGAGADDQHLDVAVDRVEPTDVLGRLEATLARHDQACNASTSGVVVARTIGSTMPFGQRTWTRAFGSSGPALTTPRGRSS